MNPLMRTNNLPSLIETFALAVRFGLDMNDLVNTITPALHNVPAVNVVENERGFRIEVAAPGLKKRDFNLNLNHNNLTILANQETKAEEQDRANQDVSREKFIRQVFGYSSFQRTFTLPTSVNADAIQATYTDGVLKIKLPKREEAKVKPARQIEIGS